MQKTKQKQKNTSSYVYFITSISFMELFPIKQYFSKALEKMRNWVLCMCVGWGVSVVFRGNSEWGSPHKSFPSGLVFGREGTSTAPIPPWEIRMIVGNKVTSCAKKEKQKLFWLHHWRIFGFSLSDMGKHERAPGRLETWFKFLKCIPGWWVLIIIRQKNLSWSPGRKLSTRRWEWSLSEFQELVGV